MNISALDNLNKAAVGAGKTPSTETLRKTAQQFEAILLMQLTSAMNGTGEADPDALFGGDGGTDLAKKMFSEQLATTMSQAGGIGLADMIMQKFGANQPAKPAAGSVNNLSNAIAAIKDIKEIREPINLHPENKISPLAGRSVKPSAAASVAAAPSSSADNAVTQNLSGLEIINQGFEDHDKPLMLDGKVLNSTRPRIVPYYALAENSAAATPAIGEISTSATSVPATGEKVTFQMPVSGRISSNFGTRFHPVDGKVKFHGGIDIAVPKNTPIGAAAEGVVKFAGWKGGYGNTVIVEHPDGTETLYGHNQKLLVREGDAVAAGQQISLSGSTGKSTGPHLHFEVRENGHVVNPRKFLSNVLPKNADRRE